MYVLHLPSAGVGGDAAGPYQVGVDDGFTVSAFVVCHFDCQSMFVRPVQKFGHPVDGQAVHNANVCKSNIVKSS